MKHLLIVVSPFIVTRIYNSCMLYSVEGAWFHGLLAPPAAVTSEQQARLCAESK